MIKRFAKISIGTLSLLFLLSGCDNKVSENTDASVEVKKDVHKSEATASNAKQEYTQYPFLDNFNITANGKNIVLIFGSKDCIYCNMLKKDIEAIDELKNRLGKEFSLYYVSTDNVSQHTIIHNGEPMAADNKLLANIYGVSGTPTIIFLDTTGKSIFTVPGYMPKSQFLTTLDFVKQNKWVNLERNSQAMYDNLKSYYIQKGIINKDGKRKDK